MGVLSRRGGVAVDGTKVAANASKHAAVSHGRADPESRIMKAGNGGHFEQAYNAQAAVNLEWSLVRLAYNFRRLAKLLAARQGPNCAPMTPRTA